MPLYEYKCRDCGEMLEKRQLMSETPLVKCPSCKKNKLERVLYPGLYAYVAKSASDFKTLGGLAQYNTDKMSKDQLLEKTIESGYNPEVAEQRKANKKLNRLDKKAQQDYIERGVVATPSDEHSLGMSSVTGKVKKRRKNKKK